MKVRDRMEAGSGSPPLYEVWGERMDGKMWMVLSTEDKSTAERAMKEAIEVYRNLVLFEQRVVNCIAGKLQHPEGERESKMRL